MVGFENYLAHVRIMSLGQRSRSQSAFKLCAVQNCVQTITSSCMVLFKNYLAEMIIMTRQCVVCKNMLLGQMSRLQQALKDFAFQIHVGPVTSSCMMSFENYLAKMIITTRQCVDVRTMSLGQWSTSQPAL